MKLYKAKMMYCCIINLVQAQDNNANEIHAKIICCGISMIYVKASTIRVN